MFPIGDQRVRDRYLSDAKYKAIVDYMQRFIEYGQLSSHELAEAAVLATQLYAEHHRAPMVVRIEADLGETHVSPVKP